MKIMSEIVRTRFLAIVILLAVVGIGMCVLAFQKKYRNQGENWSLVLTLSYTILLLAFHFASGPEVKFGNVLQVGGFWALWTWEYIRRRSKVANEKSGAYLFVIGFICVKLIVDCYNIYLKRMPNI